MLYKWSLRLPGAHIEERALEVMLPRAYIAAIPDNRTCCCVADRKARRAGKSFYPSRRKSAILSQMSHLEPILEPAVEAAGFRLVRLRLLGGHIKTLQVMAERPDGTMNVDDCARLSRALLDFLERENPLEGDYELEVS